MDANFTTCKSMANFSLAATIFTANNTLKTCYRNPVLVRTAGGALLCFIEERYRGASWRPSGNSSDHTCPDNYGVHGHPSIGGHNLGFARSDDGGATWSAIVRLAGNLSNLVAKNGVDYTNNAIVAVTMPSCVQRLIYQYGTQNNPSRARYGRILQRHSDDGGTTWSSPTDVTYAGEAVGYPGATPGPARGVQMPSGRIVFCNWGNRANVSRGTHGWNEAANFANFLSFSDDYGATWNATAPIEGARERGRSAESAAAARLFGV